MKKLEGGGSPHHIIEMHIYTTRYMLSAVCKLNGFEFNHDAIKVVKIDTSLIYSGKDTIIH